MFTGVWPAEHGIMGTKARLSMHWTTAAEHFYAHGYRTWAVATSVRFAPGVQLHQGFEQYEVFMGEHPVKVGDKAMKVAAREIPSTPDQPWFGFIHLLDVHAPYGVPEPHQSRYLSEPSVLRPDQTVDFIHEHRHDPKAVSDRQLHDLKAMYAGGVSYVDTRIQELVDAVKAHPRPTVIVLTSDHGEGFFENGYLGHGSRVWDPITRVPLILWAPERLPAGARRTTLAQSIDLFPTMSALAGLPLPDRGRGIDLSPVARGEGEVTGRTVLTQSETHSGVVRDVKGRLFKLVQRYHKDAAHRYVRLYDLTADPGEQLAVGSRNPEVRDALKAYAADHHRSAFKAQREAWERSAEEDEMLKEIGYME
jgi:arylsulfatase A-like enzyme